MNPLYQAGGEIERFWGFGGEEPIIDALLAQFQPRRADVKEFALLHRVVLVQASNGTPLDISLAALPFEERLIERSSPYRFSVDAVLVTCSAEDLVVLKAFADRPQDWLDIQGITVRQRRGLNRRLILEELIPLLELKEDLRPASSLQHLFDRHP